MTANVIVCGSCGAAIDIKVAVSVTANGQQVGSNETANPQQIDSNIAVVEDIGFGSKGSKGLKVRTYNPSTGRKRFVYDDPDFAAFWAAYPLHKEKAAAWRAWQKVLAAGVAAPQTLIDAAAKYATYCDSNDVDLRHRKHPSGWLNDGRWEDEYPEPKADARYQPYDHEAHLRALEDL